MIAGYVQNGCGEDAVHLFVEMKWGRERLNKSSFTSALTACAHIAALLGVSRIHGNTELGEKATEIIFTMEPDNSGVYVLLSNLFAASGS